MVSCRVVRVIFIMFHDDENQFLMSRALFEVSAALRVVYVGNTFDTVGIGGSLCEELFTNFVML